MPEQADIVLIPFPFSDLQSTKTRPVLVVSCDEYNRGSIDFLGMAITSNLTVRAHGLLLRQKDLQDGNLKVDSMVRADKIYSLNRDLIRRKFGSVSTRFLARVLQGLDKVLGR